MDLCLDKTVLDLRAIGIEIGDRAHQLFRFPGVAGQPVKSGKKKTDIYLLFFRAGRTVGHLQKMGHVPHPTALQGDKSLADGGVKLLASQGMAFCLHEVKGLLVLTNPQAIETGMQITAVNLDPVGFSATIPGGKKGKSGVGQKTRLIDEIHVKICDIHLQGWIGTDLSSVDVCGQQLRHFFLLGHDPFKQAVYAWQEAGSQPD